MLLDNLTMLGAARALSPEFGSRAFQVDPSWNKKWNYLLNNHMRTAVDIACLAQLVHAIVLSEEIQIDLSYADRWLDPQVEDTLKERVPVELDGVGEVLNFFDTKQLGWSRLVVESVGRASAYVQSRVFKQYLAILAQEPVWGTFLDISNGYFQTGYSDKEIFDDLCNPRVYRKLQNDLLRESAFVMLRIKMGDERREVEYDEMGRVCDVLEEFDNDLRLWCGNLPGLLGEDEFEKNAGAEDLVRNMTAALYYADVASLCGVTYMPHPLRTAFMPFDDIDSLDKLDADGLVRFLEYLRTLRTTETSDGLLNPFGGKVSGYVDIKMPLILAEVLQNSSSREHVIEKALDLRNSKPARRLREWFTDIEERTSANEIGISELSDQTETLRRAIAQWWDHRPSTVESGKFETNLALNLGIVTLTHKFHTIPHQWKSGRYRQLRLIKNLARLSDDTLRLGPLIERVLGRDVAKSWQLGSDALSGGKRSGNPMLAKWKNL